jgi:hypothetical protein
MRDGRLIFQFENGVITGVLENAGLDEFYERLFRNARRSVRRSGNHVTAGIKMVIFGAFWLEALSNLILRQALIHEAREESFGIALWNALRRAALLEKLELLRSVASDVLQIEYRDLLPGLKRVLDLRNRLAHFKDSNSPIAESVGGVDEALRVLLDADDPLLIQELKSPAILLRAESVLKAARWMSQMQKDHNRKRGIVQTRKNFHRSM